MSNLSRFSELLQIVGVIGLIASLIFVGLELRQSQRIALAEQHVERTKVFTEVINTATNNGIAYFYRDHDYDKYEIYEHNFWHMFWNVSETDYLKYRLGLMDEGIWQARYGIMKKNKSREGYTNRRCEMSKRVWQGKSTQLDSEFVKLINAIPSKDCI